ncbi:translational activator of cytochrome c oxidase 1-like [Neocloeon triangulifer]|uniref:translational activator of cytochrome c oxidase 1-like n=1 Tax=Neocloeon triangulifer TaxID=2078957 RepID=UPI00286FA2E4|nr:translational activator of cytochrome c oxidase 1-like [Neocloeon triangulifer]
MANVNKTVFATVGTTKFDKFTEVLVTTGVLKVLKGRGFTRLMIQYGNGSFIPPDCNLEGVQISSYRFKDSLKQDMSSADLVISHAGAGTCLEALELGKKLVVVVNEDLTDNHQVELAKKFADMGYLLYSTCVDLANLDMSSLLVRLSGKFFRTAPASILIPKRLAGHSKWANIKHIKALKDGIKSNTFLKLSSQIKVAINEAGGNSDPNSNHKLKSVIEVAKKNNMPSETIQRVLERAKAVGKAVTVEMKGPGGCWLILSLVSNNAIGVKNSLKSKCRKYMFQEAPGGSKTSFDYKGVIVAKPESGAASLEASLEHAIEAGAEDVVCNEEDGTLEFQCDPRELFKVQHTLMQLKYDIMDSSNKHIPKNKVKLPDESLEVISELIDYLSQIPEIVEVVDNIE